MDSTVAMDGTCIQPLDGFKLEMTGRDVTLETTSIYPYNTPRYHIMHFFLKCRTLGYSDAVLALCRVTPLSTRCYDVVLDYSFQLSRITQLYTSASQVFVISIIT